MEWLENLKIRNKLGLVLLVPVLSLLIFSVYLLNTELQNQKQLENLSHAENFVSIVTRLIHDLQLERAYSIGFLQSEGALFHAELIKQHQINEQLWKDIKITIQRHEDDFKLTNLEEIKQNIKSLEILRDLVTSKSIAPLQALDNYIKLIQNLFNQLETLTLFISNPNISRSINGYLSYLLAKELAGQERARGGLLYSSSGSFQAHSILIKTLITQQELLLKLATEQAPENIQLLLDSPKNSTCIKRIQKKLIKQDLSKEQKKQADIDRWLSLSTCHIEQLHETAQLYLEQVQADIKMLISKARRFFYLFILFTLVPIILSLILIYLVDRNVNNNLLWLLKAMEKIANGNFNPRLPPQSKDELGRLSFGLDKLRLQLSEHDLSMKERLKVEQKQNQDLTQRTEKLQQFAAKIAKGDIRQQLDEDNSTTTQLSHSLNQMFDGLSAFSLQIRDSSKVITNMVSELHSSINNQSSGASEQAASVNQTVVTLGQLKNSSSQTLLKAKTLGEIAEKARHEGDNGREAIEQSIVDVKSVQSKMDTIAHTILTLNDWIQRIGDITTSVHDVSRQLRLISLNAAIEASNAGEAGKGFGVVAAEVKQLAERSQQSTIHVQSILEEIHLATDRAVMATEEGSKGVELGLKQIQRTGEVIHNLESAVGDTSIASKQIVVAVNQEVSGIEQINMAINEIHAVTNKFAETANQSRNAAEELTNLVKHLDNTINQYQL